MIRQAVLYLASPDDADAAQLLIAGRPLAFRALVAALRAGALRVGVPSVFRRTAVEDAIAESPRARAAVTWLPDDTPDNAPALLLPAAALASPTALARLLAVPAPAVLAASRGTAAPVVSVDAALVQALAPRLADGTPIADVLAAALGPDVGTTHGEEWFVRVRDSADARRAEAHLFAALGSPIDTRLDRIVHRRLSRPVSRLAVAWGIGPNPITLLSAAAGAVGAWCLWGATPLGALAAVLCYLVAVVLDHSDGEVARLGLTESALGEWLDIGADTVVHTLLVIAMGVTTSRVAGGMGAVTGAIAAAGVVASAVLAKVSPAITREDGDRFGRALAGLGNRDGYYVMLLAFVLALTALPAALPALMALVAVGSHAYWLGRAAYALRRR